MTYKWQHSVDGGNAYFDINPNGGVFSGSRSPTLGVYAGMTDLSSVWNGARFRCIVESAGVELVSNPAVLTVVPVAESSSQSSGCENECSALGEVTDENCACNCQCPEGEVNTGVAFAPNGDLVCECLFSSLWVRVEVASSSSSGEVVLGMLEFGGEACVSLAEFDPSRHTLTLQDLFDSEAKCLDNSSSSSSSDCSYGLAASLSTVLDASGDHPGLYYGEEGPNGWVAISNAQMEFRFEPLGTGGLAVSFDVIVEGKVATVTCSPVYVGTSFAVVYGGRAYCGVVAEGDVNL